MKTTLLISAFLLTAACSLKAEVLPADTTILYKGKRIKVEDSNEQVKVKVFADDESDNTKSYKLLYEGIYNEEKSHETWFVQEKFGIEIPFITKKKRSESRMVSHWGGTGLGFANIADKSFNMTEVNGVKLDASSSYEFLLNLSSSILPLYRNNFGITSGIGMSWLNLRFDKKTHLADVDGVTSVFNSPEGIRYSLSRLMVVRINIPLMFEWQPTINGRNKAFFSAGVVGGIKTFSSYLIKYKEQNKNVKTKDRGLNTTPLSLDYMVHAGYGHWGIYAKYSPFSVFMSKKGPDIRAVSVGLLHNF